MSTLTILQFSPQVRWHFQGNTATLRIKYTDNFTDSAGQAVLHGLYQEVACTVVDGELTVPAFNLITTNDALINPNVRCSAQLFDANGSGRDWLFQDFSIPQSLTPSCTIAALMTYNRGNALVSPPNTYLTRDQTVGLVTSMLAAVGLGPATNVDQGLVRLRIAADTPADPEVYGTNDPLVRDAIKWQGKNLDALMASPADTNVPVFDAASETWKPGVGVQGAAGGDLSGVYPNPSVVDDSHSHSAATITSVPVHGPSHELGGGDQISIAGLSGVAGDPQIAGAVLETSGPTLMVMGAVADGEFLKRDGATVIGATSPGGGVDVQDEGTPGGTFTTLNFTGAGVAATDAGGGVADITIPGGAGVRLFQFEFDGRGAVIDPLTIPEAVLPFSPITGTIIETYIKDLDDISGTCEIDLRVAPRGSAPPGPGDSICGASSNRPKTTAESEAVKTDFTGWSSTTISDDDEVRAVVISNSDHKHLMLVVTVQP